MTMPPESTLHDIDAARRYLRELAAACAEGATSTDPRVIVAALALVAHQARKLRS